MDNFSQAHHRRSIRLQNHDYTSGGWYYVTICTHNRILFFKNEQIKQIIGKYWSDIPNHFNNVTLGEYIIMPNHVHGIVVIEPPMSLTSSATAVGAIHEWVGAIHELPLREQQRERMKQRRQMLLPKIIGWFKMNSAKQINILKNRPGQPLWQRNYYESIIRDEQSLNRIRQYIKDNPFNWGNDRNNPKNYASQREDRQNIECTQRGNF